MYHQDWLMRQIEAFISFLIYMLTGKQLDQEAYTAQLLNTNELYKIIRELIEQRQICKAEDMLFEYADGINQDALRAALQFYQHINQWSDGQLAECNFSREEIMDGIKVICGRYQISQYLLSFRFDE